MNASIEGSLLNLNRAYPCFTHRGESMTKDQVKVVLEYGKKKGYTSTGQLTDEEVDNVLKSFSERTTVLSFSNEEIELK